MNGDVGLGGHNVLVLVMRSLYQALSTLTGIVGLTPIQVGYAVATFVALAFVVQIVQALRGRTSFTLTPDDPDA